MSNAVDAYCFDEVAQPRLQHPTARAKRIEDFQQGAAKGRGDVCAAHARERQPLALEYNHRTGEWASDTGGFEARGRKIEIDPVTKTPTAHLVNGDEVGIIVTDTNPVLFVANRGDAKEDNIDQVKSLEQLLALLGPALGGLLWTYNAWTASRNQASRLLPRSAE